MSDFLDDSLVNDFLTESNELIEQLDADLVRLESECTPDLLDQIFRALHTIKGAASFLNLGEVTSFAHAAEDALNKLRKGEAQVNEDVIDAMLRSVDVLRHQLNELSSGSPLTPGPEDLVEILHAIAGAEPAPTTQIDAPKAGAPASSGGAETGVGGAVINTIELPPQKADVLPFMVDDMLDCAAQIEECAKGIESGTPLTDVAPRITELSETLSSTAEFFDLEILISLVRMVGSIGENCGSLDSSFAPQIALRLRAIVELIKFYGETLGESKESVWPLSQFEERLNAILDGNPVEDEASANAKSVDDLLEADGVFASGGATLSTAEPVAPAAPAPSSDTKPEPKGEEPTSKGGGQAEQTVRVEVKRLEALMNLVGEMVLTKNQIRGIGRTLHDHALPHEIKELVGSAVSDLDRLTGELQVGVMRTRMQPLEKLFGRYPRIIRDLARATNKKIDLKIIGGDTEVDKSVLELLADPMVHILRNSADHGIEMPEDRVKAGKPETGQVTIRAAHQGGHVRVEISDNGKGLSRDKLSQLAIERGITTEAAVAGMTDVEVYQFIFAAGFSTAKEVSNLSGRGVGMDVVRTNITKLGGEVHVNSTPGEGTCIEITIPLTVAILPAMLVGIGTSEYAIPVANIVEIVKPDESNCYSVAGSAVLRLREAVLPLIDMTDRLGEPRDNTSGQFAVVIEAGQHSAGLLVNRLVGQQEVVIKSLDDEYTSGGPFSGATIREDGDVSLILDVAALVRNAQMSDQSPTPIPERAAA